MPQAQCHKVDGVEALRPKDDGQGIMVSAVTCETEEGFGCKVKGEVFDAWNAKRTTEGKAALSEQPGIRKLKYGKQTGGETKYWQHEDMERQMAEVLDLLSFAHPDRQFLLEVDHSSNHGKGKDDAKNVNGINVCYGGAQRHIRDMEITEGCLGPFPAKMMLNGKEVDCKLKVGDTQCSRFSVEDPPPFYELSGVDQKRIGKQPPEASLYVY